MAVILTLFGVKLAPCASKPDSSSDTPLQTAQILSAGDYRGWTYGSNPKHEEINCVQFLIAVLEAYFEKKLEPKDKKAIAIDYPIDDLGKAIEQDDPRIRGVQHALVTTMKMGRIIPPNEVESGDLVQYWMKRKNGTWFGHAAIVSKVHKGESGPISVTLYGSHQSTDGIAHSRFKLKLKGDSRHLYFVRATPKTS